MFKVGFTTVIISKELKPYFLEAIESSDSIQEYLSQIEYGRYLSPKGQEFLWDHLMDWDPEYSENLIKQIELDEYDAENWEDNIGDEGMHNLNNCMD